MRRRRVVGELRRWVRPERHLAASHLPSVACRDEHSSASEGLTLRRSVRPTSISTFGAQHFGKCATGASPTQLTTVMHGIRQDRISVSAADRRRIVGELRRWVRPERHLAVGVGGVSARCRRRPPEAIDVLGASLACRRLVVGEPRGWIRPESSLALGVTGLTFRRSVRPTPISTFGAQHFGKCAAGASPTQLATDSAWHSRRPDFAPRPVSAARRRRIVGASSAGFEGEPALNPISQSVSAVCRQDVRGGLRKPFAPNAATDSMSPARCRRDVGSSLARRRRAPTIDPP